MSEITLRPATRSDHPQMVALKMSALGSDQTQVEQWLLEALERDTAVCLVATTGSTVVGFVQAMS